MHYSLTRATLWNLSGYLYLIVASLVATPILVHNLGFALFAQYSLVVAVLAVVSSLDLGLPQAVVRSLARTRGRKARETVWATSSVLFVMAGLVAGLLATIFAYHLHIRYETLPVIFALALIHNLVSHYQALALAEGHFGYFNTKTFIVGTANTLGAALLAWRGEGIAEILSAELACYLLSLLPLTYFSLKLFPHPWLGRPSRTVARSLLSFGLRNQVGKLVGQVQAQYGKYLVALISPFSLSAYVIAQGLVQKLAGGVVQLASALYPGSVAGTDHISIKQLYHRLQLSLLSISLLGIVGFSIWGLGFLRWWLSAPDLTQLVYSLLQVLVWYFAILVLTPLASTMLDAHGHPGITALFALITAVIEITLTLYLLPQHGVFAPVYAALIAVLLTTPALLLTVERAIRVK